MAAAARATAVAVVAATAAGRRHQILQQFGPTPRERTLLPRVRFNANTGQVLQSVAEEDELVLSTFNRCLTSLSDSDETENELFV